jgi:hypothetical protein
LFFIIILKSNVLKGWDLWWWGKRRQKRKKEEVARKRRNEKRENFTFRIARERAVHKTWESCGARILSTLLNANDRSYDVVHSYTHKK